MRNWVLLAFFLLFFYRGAAAAVDPLGIQFFPLIDENPADYPSNITVTDSMYKVFQSSAAPGTVHWAIVYSMQNEIQSFQVHVTPAVNIPSLTVTMSSLTNAQTGTVISSATTDIIVYREYYMNISTPTSIGASYYNVRAAMPDQLIPVKDPYYNQTTNAFPVSVSSGSTQSAWFDVHIPTYAPSGYYSGTVTVSSGATTLATLPVVYAVWAWLMPSTASLPMVGSGFGYDGFCDVVYGGEAGCSAYPDSGGGSDGANTQIWIDGSVQMLDNRYTIDSPSNIFPESGSFTTYISSIGPLINGTQAHVKSILPGAALTRVELNNITFTSAEWQNFATNFSNQGWSSRLFNYLADEPSGATWAKLVSSGTATRGFSTPIVPNLVTTDYSDAQANGALGAIDYITPIINNLDVQGGSNHRADYNAYLLTSSGPVRQIGTYQDCESADTCSNGVIGDANATWPNLHIDGLPVPNRTLEWLSFLNNINYELYFAVDICDNTGNCLGNDPWTSVYTFGCNGDGTLMYPCSSGRCGTSSGIPIWVPSIRLKHIREGMQDYEYLNYLTKKGQSAFVQTQILSWITNAYTFNRSPAGLEAARMALGTAIHQLTYPPPSISSTILGGRLRGSATLR